MKQNKLCHPTTKLSIYMQWNDINWFKIVALNILRCLIIGDKHQHLVIRGCTYLFRIKIHYLEKNASAGTPRQKKNIEKYCIVESLIFKQGQERLVNAEIEYLLNKMNVMHHSVFKLGSTSRENKVLIRLPHPVLFPLEFGKPSMRNISKPNLKDKTRMTVNPIAITFGNHKNFLKRKKKRTAKMFFQKT